MKIALDCRAAFKGMGGIGRYTWSLLQEYAKVDTRDEFVCYFTHLEPPGPLTLPGQFRVKTFEAGMIDERFDQLVLPDLLERDGIDVYHNPTFAVPLVRGRARTVSTIHDVVFKRHPNLVEKRLARYLDKATLRSARMADLIITVSEFSKREIMSLYNVPADRIRVIPNGGHLPRLGWEGRANSKILQGLGLKTGGYALYVGSLEPKKNIRVLLDTFSSLAKEGRHPDLKLVLAGGGGSPDYPVDSLAQSPNLKGKVLLTGYVPEETLEALYHHALVFVYPSLYEGFGLPPLEAMARGVPTIVSDASSLPEVVGAAGLCIDPSRPDLFAKAIADLASDPDRRQELSIQGRQRAKEFTWKRSALAHLEVFTFLGSIKHENTASRV